MKRAALLLAACSSSSSKPAPDAAACSFAANTIETATVTNGCALRTRDTGACEADRTAQGLSGEWLAFSCRVTLTKMTDRVHVVSDGEPDYPSNYYATSTGCHEDYTPSFPDPNMISAQQIALDIPLAPNTTNTRMGLGPVGVALDGVAIFDNQAAPGDDIFQEALSFDRCGGHPAPGGMYHFHGEPYSISYDDSNLIGVLRDGYFVYGRRDTDGTLPTLDANGGHAAPGYHYHLSLQTNGTEMQWFLTTGTYEGAPL